MLFDLDHFTKFISNLNVHNYNTTQKHFIKPILRTFNLELNIVFYILNNFLGATFSKVQSDTKKNKSLQINLKIAYLLANLKIDVLGILLKL